MKSRLQITSVIYLLKERQNVHRTQENTLTLDIPVRICSQKNKIRADKQRLWSRWENKFNIWTSVRVSAANANGWSRRRKKV